VQTLGESTNDLNRFKSAVRDFLIQLKEFSAGDNAELYIEEKEAAEKQKAAQDREAAAKIPGMLKPSQIEDKDEI
jgi:exportin-1